MVKNKGQALKEHIDADEGLKSKRIWLTTLSVIVIALSLAGIKITEVNTLIFNLDVENKEVIGLLLALSVVFLMIRYFSYAKKYHDDLTDLWKKDLMNDHEVGHIDYEGREFFGMAYKKVPDWFHTSFDLVRQENISQKVIYRCSFPFRRCFVYSSYYENNDDCRTECVSILSNLGFYNYIKILAKEFKYKLSGFVNYPESLDIYAPYFLGSIAIASYVFMGYGEVVASFLINNWSAVLYFFEHIEFKQLVNYVGHWWALVAIIIPALYLLFGCDIEKNSTRLAVFDFIWLLSAVATIMFAIVAYDKVVIDKNKYDALKSILDTKNEYKDHISKNLDKEAEAIIREKNENLLNDGSSLLTLYQQKNVCSDASSPFLKWIEKIKQDSDASMKVCLPTDTEHVILYRIYHSINNSIVLNDFELLDLTEILNYSPYLDYVSSNLDMKNRINEIVQDAKNRSNSLKEEVKNWDKKYNEELFNEFSKIESLLYFWFIFVWWLPIALGMRLIKSIEDIKHSMIPKKKDATLSN